ncbi:MAG: hypothetical protein REH79_02880 [Spiroplasma sp.]|nr:hypothetical protein [Spiroplasma sp.]
MPQIEEKDWWKYLKTKKNNYHFPPTKIITTKNQINNKILILLDKKAEVVGQLSDYGLIVLDKTILNSSDDKSISEQGIISSDFFKARVIDVNNKIINNVHFHLVKVISGIIAINPDHKITLQADEEFNKKLNANILAAKLFTLFLNHYYKVKRNPVIKNKNKINDQQFQLRFRKKSNLTEDTIFEIRDLINKFLFDRKLSEQKYQFLIDSLTKAESKQIFKLEKIEIKSFVTNGISFIVNFLVGKKNIDQYFLNVKKDLLGAIKVINKKIKIIDNDQLISQFYFDDEIKSFEDLTKLNADYLKFKTYFSKFQNQNLELIKTIVDQSVETHYSEKITDYEVVHISFNNLLIDQGLLELKAKERLTNGNNKILFLSNNNLDNSLLVWKISPDLVNEIKLKPLVAKFSASSFIKTNYQKNDTVFIEANNYQVINDFIQNIIKTLKTKNK